MTASIHNLAPYICARDQQDAIEQAEIAAGFFFNKATVAALARHNARMASSRNLTGDAWRAHRDLSLRQYKDDTAAERKLCDETSEWFLAHGVDQLLPDHLDEKWTALIDRARLETVSHAMAAAE